MTAYKDLIRQIESLTKQAEEIRKAELASVIAEIKRTMAAHGLTIADLRPDVGAKPGKKTHLKVAVKYRNAVNGETWTGRGRTPKWLTAAEAGGASRKSFLI